MPLGSMQAGWEALEGSRLNFTPTQQPLGQPGSTPQTSDSDQDSCRALLAPWPKCPALTENQVCTVGFCQMTLLIGWSRVASWSAQGQRRVPWQFQHRP